MPDIDTSKLKAVVRRLLARAAATAKPAATAERSAFRVCETLREPLSKLVGVGGFHSLMSRALVLAGADVPWLRSLYLAKDGSLAGLDKLNAKLEPHLMEEGDVAVASELLGLLVTFIGPDLTLWLLRDIWPKLDDLNF